MVEHARRLHPGIDFRQGDAEDLPFGSNLFDAAVMNFGILHLARPEKALADAQRVLRAGGRFAFSVWCDPQQTVGFGIVLRAVQEHGEPRAELPEGPPFFFYSDPEKCKAGLLAAGFASPVVTKVLQTWQLPAGDGLFEAMRDSTVRTAGLLRAQKPVVLDNIRDAMREELSSYQKRDQVALPMPALIASAIKP
jgi:SAM-dependent methyltransferase